ncbi:MAG: hypothetical protein ACM36C_04340, partial [Acidobacteriota bacterium]
MQKSLTRGAFALLSLLSLIVPAACQPPPILDRELFLGNPENSAAHLSPHGQFIAFIKPGQSTPNI